MDDTKREIANFILAVMEEWQPDLLIVVERRGTAIIRALKESPECGLRWPWERIVSSRVLDQLPPDALVGKRIVIFDDMKRRGSHIERVLRQLECLDPSGQTLRTTCVAVYAMHEDATSRFVGNRPQVRQHWCLRGLTTEAYRNKRLRILTMLQECGSLMLDTEHLEVRVCLTGALPLLVDALRRRANVVAFRSLAGRQNFTVFYADEDSAHPLPAESLPPGSVLSGIVKKCRIIERGANEFAILPICYPAIPAGNRNWPVSAADRELLGDASRRSTFASFYGSALLSALTILEWVLKSIYAAGTEVASVYLPAAVASELGGYSLEHLRAMYPTLSIEALLQRIREADSRAAHSGAQVRRHAADVGTFESPPPERMEDDSWTLLRAIRYHLDELTAAEYIYDENWEVPVPFGLTAHEIFDLAARLGYDRPYTSSLFDVLIDNGHLVTQVGSLDLGSRGLSGRGTVLTRVFEPDGEMVSELVRMFTLQQGLPRGL